MKHDDLTKLINTLSVAEKRFFTKGAGTKGEGKKKNYLRLYHLYEQNPSLSAKEMELLCKEKGISEKLAWNRTHLSSLLLKSLRHQYEGISVPDRAQLFLDEGRLLYRRKLYRKSLQRIRKGQVFAEKYDQFHAWAELLEREIVLLRELQDKGYVKMIAAIKERYIVVMRWLELKRQLEFLRNDLVIATRSRLTKSDDPPLPGFEVPEVEEIIEKIPFSLQVLWFFCQSSISRLKGNFEASYNWEVEIIKRWETNSDIVAAFPGKFVRHLNNYLSACFLTKRNEEGRRAIDKFKLVPSPTEDIKAEIFQNEYSHRLLYDMNNRNYEGGLKHIPAIEKGLKIYQDKINPAKRLAFYWNLSICYWLVEDPGKALVWNNRIYEPGPSGIRIDIRIFGVIFQLILIYSLGDTPRLEYAHHATYERLRASNQLGKFEKLSLSFIGKLMKYESSPNELRKAILQMEKELQKHPKSQFGYEEMALWLKSLRSGKRLRDLV